MSGHLPFLVRWLCRTGVLPRAAVTQLDARQAPSAQSVLDAGRLAEKTYQLLDQLGQEVVLIARMGQNLTQFGLRHSHIGYAVKNLRRGDWGIVHLLNGEDGPYSGIFTEGMVNYFSDSPFRFEAEVLTLPVKHQAALRDLLTKTPRQVHCRDYSLTSHPWSLTTQNSNQWVLELLACVLGDLKEHTRPNAQAWLRENGYQPSALKISLPTQWAGPLLRDSIRFQDQPEDRRRAGVVSTVTVDSIFNWLLADTGPFKESLAEVRTVSVSI